MAHSIPPTPLSLRRRIDLWMARFIALVFFVINKLRPLPKPPQPVSVHRYGPHPDENLQFIPARADAPSRAPLVFIHGGGWIIMKKELYTRALIEFAEAGYPVFNLEYPLAPEHPHPGMLLSLLEALRWIRGQHPEVQSVHLMGDSAGGNLAMMLGILSHNPRLLRVLGPSAPSEVPVSIASVVSLYGVLDRLSWRHNGFPGVDLMLECYGGKVVFEERVPADKAITPMDLEFDSYPPSFLVAGSKDRLCEATRICSKRLESIPGVAKTKIYEGEIHGFFSMEWRPGYSELRRDIFEFLEAHEPRGDLANELHFGQVNG
mgnify:FL=1